MVVGFEKQIPNIKNLCGGVLGLPQSHNLHIFFILVVACPVPAVQNGYATINSKNDGLMLPGNITAAYSCVPGYQLENPKKYISKCEYHFQNRAGRYKGDRNRLVKAIWKGQEAIRCGKGWNYSAIYSNITTISNWFLRKS